MSLKLKNTEKYLKNYAKGLLDFTIKELDRNDRTRNYNTQSITSAITASGSLKDSLRIVQKKGESILQLNLEGNSYAEQIDEGTTSTSVSKDKLIQWIQNKNGFKDLKGNIIKLTDTKKIDRIASLISKSLKLKGIKATNFLSDIVKLKFIELNNIEDIVKKDIDIDFDNILLRAGYKKKGKETYIIETKIKE